MKNKLIDLNNHLFAQLERLGAEEMIDSNNCMNVAITGGIIMYDRKAKM